MTRTVTLAVVLALAALLVPGRAALAGDSQLERGSLKGLRGVYVVVENFREINKGAGFDDRTFTADVELKLRKAGIKVVSREQWLASQGTGRLYLQVSAMHDQPGANAPFSTNLVLVQGVMLTRNPSIRSVAATWSTTSVSYGPLPYARQVVKDMVADFTNAWFSVNPKE